MDRITQPTHRSTGQRVLRGVGLGAGLGAAAGAGAALAPWVSAAIGLAFPLAAVAEATLGVQLACVGFGAIGWIVGTIFATTLDPTRPGWDPEFHAAETFPVPH